MANDYAARDGNRIPALLGHSGTAGTAETRRVVVDSDGALMVNIGGTESVVVTVGTIAGGSIDTPKYQLQMDGTTTANVTYVGEAAIGSATSGACWRIKKIDETTSDVLIVTWAGTTPTFSQVWDNRGTLGYA